MDTKTPAAPAPDGCRGTVRAVAGLEVEDESATEIKRARLSTVPEDEAAQQQQAQAQAQSPQTAHQPQPAKNRCFGDMCKNKVAVLVGHCKYCDSDFCMKHRLPEVHACKNQTSVRDTAFEANKAQLMNGKTEGLRGRLERI
jgi:hypothetical protein